MRKTYYDSASKSSDSAFGLGINFEEFNQYVIKALGILFAYSGVSILTGSTKSGAFILIMCMMVVIFVKDNPYLKQDITSVKVDAN